MNKHQLASTLSVSITIAEYRKDCKDYLTLLKLLTTLCTHLMIWPFTLPVYEIFNPILIQLQHDNIVFAKSEITFAGIVLSDNCYKIQHKILNSYQRF